MAGDQERDECDCGDESLHVWEFFAKKPAQVKYILVALLIFRSKLVNVYGIHAFEV
jgi:hypothetical protein